MHAKVFSAAINGLDASLIEVEVDISGGLAVFNIVGLPDKAVEESKERVSAALKNSAIAVSPQSKSQRIIINLAPANLKKQGSLYDLPIAIGYLLATHQIKFSARDKLFCGELSLDGRLRHVNGILAVADLARKKGFKELYVPSADAEEAALVRGIQVKPVESLKQIVSHFNGVSTIKNVPSNNYTNLLRNNLSSKALDFAYIKGQSQAKRALELAAAGGHNVIFTGPPGSGKTILAKSFATILPKMALDEALEVTRIFSVAGLLPSNQPLLAVRPFRSPHHSASSISLVGGGSFPHPGEVTLAHRGVLFLDEFPEFPRKALEALRQPLEDGCVTISRAAGTIKFPANFILIAAMNPCPCGNFGDTAKMCTCSSAQIARYRRKISGPILDRIDIHVVVPRIKYEKLTSTDEEEASQSVRERVEAARLIQRQRFAKQNILLNSEMNNLQIKQYCALDNVSGILMKNAVSRYHLSARSYFRILKVARTIADLGQSKEILQSHLAEAIQYRVQEENS